MKLIALTLLAFFSIALHAQTYTVIHSIGKIYDTSAETYLKKGSKISESTELRFESEGARAAVLSSSRGRFIIQQNSTSDEQGDLAYTLSSVISPVRGRLSTRAGGINNLLDFQKYFEGPIAIVVNNYKVAVSSNAFPMSERTFFYVQYLYNGERINKKLVNDGDSLVFEVASLYSVDGTAIDPSKISEAQLFYYSSKSQESTLISSLIFNVVSGEDLQSLVASFQDLAQAERNKALLEIINDLYGKCTETDLLKAL